MPEKSLSNVGLTAVFGPHNTAEDFEEMAASYVKGADIVIPEMIGYTPGAVDLIQSVTRGEINLDKLVQGRGGVELVSVNVDENAAPKGELVLGTVLREGTYEHALYRALFDTRKQIVVVDVELGNRLEGMTFDSFGLFNVAMQDFLMGNIRGCREAFLSGVRILNAANFFREKVIANNLRDAFLALGLQEEVEAVMLMGYGHREMPLPEGLGRVDRVYNEMHGLGVREREGIFKEFSRNGERNISDEMVLRQVLMMHVTALMTPFSNRISKLDTVSEYLLRDLDEETLKSISFEINKVRLGLYNKTQFLASHVAKVLLDSRIALPLSEEEFETLYAVAANLC